MLHFFINTANAVHFLACPPCAPKVLSEKEHFGGIFCHGVLIGLKKDGSFGDVRAPLQ